MSKGFCYGFLIGILTLLNVSGSAQDGGDTLKVLFVGNSYTYFENLPQVVSVLSEKTGTVLVTEKVTIGGAKRASTGEGHADSTLLKKSGTAIMTLWCCRSGAWER